MTDDSTQSPQPPAEADQGPPPPVEPTVTEAAAAESGNAADLLTPVDIAAHVAPATPAAPDLRVVAVSLVGHLLLLAVIAGSIFSVAPPPPVIPVHFIPAEDAPPEKKPPGQTAEDGKAAEPKAQAKPQAQTETSQPKPPPPSETPKPAEKKPAETKPADERTAGKAPPPPAATPGSLGFADFSLPPPLSPGLLSSVRTQIERCWQVPTGWSDPRQAAVTVRFQLNRDGTLAGKPAVVEFRASPLGKTAADNAIAAITQCAPFKLPPAEYDRWSDVQLELAP